MTITNNITSISSEDQKILVNAKQLLESPSLAIKVTNYLGSPIEGALKRIPSSVQNSMNSISQNVLSNCLNLMVNTLNVYDYSEAKNRRHKFAAISSGLLGAGGWGTFPLEMAASTSIILRSIADNARSQGIDLSDSKNRLECLNVLALGGRSEDDDGAETSYFTIRSLLAYEVNQAARYIAEKGVTEHSAPIIVKMLSTLTARFGLVLSEKAAAVAVPIIGGIGGAAINGIFIDHFQKMAKGHFTMQRLIAKYDLETVENLYKAIPVN